MRRLEAYEWPGNVRELENTMERAVALETTPEITLRVLPDRIAGYASRSALSAANGNGDVAFPAEGVDFEKEVADAERRYLQAALEKSQRGPHAGGGPAEDQLPVVSGTTPRSTIYSIRLVQG